MAPASVAYMIAPYWGGNEAIRCGAVVHIHLIGTPRPDSGI